MWAASPSLSQRLSRLVPAWWGTGLSFSFTCSEADMAMFSSSSCQWDATAQIALWEEYSCKLEQRVHALTHENDALQRQIIGVQETLAAGEAPQCPLVHLPHVDQQQQQRA
jgi:hypothetical protein